MAQGSIEDLVRAATLIAVPWVNGGGVTRVIADRPDFRLSLATIAQEGPFSVIPGMLRHFVLIAGRVDLSGSINEPLDPTSPPVMFAGDSPIHAIPLGGPALALNLMVPMGAPPLRLERGEPGTAGDAVAVFACEPQHVDGVPVDTHDTVFTHGSVTTTGRVVRVMR